MFHCSVIKVLCCSHQTALIVYHVQNRLSRTFFISFFAFHKLLFVLSIDNFYNLSYQLLSVKNFFNFFWNQLAFKKWLLCDSQTIITSHTLTVNCFLSIFVIFSFFYFFAFNQTNDLGIKTLVTDCFGLRTSTILPSIRNPWSTRPTSCSCASVSIRYLSTYMQAWRGTYLLTL